MDKITYLKLKNQIGENEKNVVIKEVKFNLEKITNLYHKDFLENPIFIATDVADFIQRSILNKSISTSSSILRNHTITVFSFGTDRDEVIEVHKNLHKLINFITNFSLGLRLPNTHNYLNNGIGIQIRIYLTDKKKKFLPEDDFTPNNTNSGFTSHNEKDETSIVIYRKEELLKVFIHELLHNVPLAPSNLDANSELIEKYLPCHKYIKYAGNSNSLASNSLAYEREQIYVREAYVETITSYLISIYLSNSYEDYQLIFEKLLDYFKHMNYYLRKIKTCMEMNDNCKWDESTNTFGYYVVKEQMIKNYNFNLDNLSLSWEELFKLCSNVCNKIESSPVLDKFKTTYLKMTNLDSRVHF